MTGDHNEAQVAALEMTAVEAVVNGLERGMMLLTDLGSEWLDRFREAREALVRLHAA